MPTSYQTAAETYDNLDGRVRTDFDGGDIVKILCKPHSGGMGEIKGTIRQAFHHTNIVYSIDTDDGDRINIMQDGTIRSKEAADNDYRTAPIGTVNRMSLYDRRGIVVFDPYTEKFYSPGDTCPRCGYGSLQTKDANYSDKHDHDDRLQCNYKRRYMKHHDPDIARALFDIQQWDSVEIEYGSDIADETKTIKGFVVDKRNWMFVVCTGYADHAHTEGKTALCHTVGLKTQNGAKPIHGKVFGGDWPHGQSANGEVVGVEVTRFEGGDA